MRVKRVASCGLFMHEARCDIIGAEGRTHGRFNLDSSDFNYEDIKKADEEGIVTGGRVWSEPFKIINLTYRRYDDWTSPAHVLTYSEFFRLSKPRRLHLEVNVSYSLAKDAQSRLQHIDFIRLNDVEPEGDRNRTPWFAGERL